MSDQKTFKQIMNMKELKFEGYQGVITEMDFESGMIHGEVLLTKDVVTFKATNIKDLAKEFKASVADYLEFCREDGVTPNKPLKGEVLVRCGEDMQAEIIKLIAAKKLAGEKVSQNERCTEALKADRRNGMKINLELIESFDPCKDGLENFKKHHTKFYGTELELLELDNVSVSDKLWLLLREEFIPENDLHELACKFSESVLHLFEEKYPDDKRPRKAIEAKRKFIKGEISEKELGAARDAARDAARAARDAARAAVGAAVGAAAWDARAAARAAAWYAVRDAWADEEQKQLQIVKKYFEQIGETE